jgi:hypothetical protein
MIHQPGVVRLARRPLALSAEDTPDMNVFVPA